MWKYNGKTRPDFAIEPADGQESVWGYPRPPICVEEPRRVVVRFQKTTIAETTNAIRILETASPPTFYIPQDDINFDFLLTSPGSSFCEWKGAATYWSLEFDNTKLKNVGWSYQSPTKRFESIRGYLSFYPAKLDCKVDGETVRPQPGGFYGGWVTDEIVGPCKGEPGTGGW